MKSHLLHLLISFFVAAVALVGYRFWYAAIAAKSAEVAYLQSQITAKTDAASRIASTEAALAEIAGDTAIVQSYFVPETGVVEFINGLKEDGQTQGAAVRVLSVSTGSAGVQPTLTLALSITGTFSAVMRTVGAIEYAPYGLSISNLSVIQNANDTWRADIEMLVSSVKTNTL